MTTSVIVGGGILGLTCARAIARRSSAGSSVFLLEAGTLLGAETSARNSGVIHSGIYYPTGSAKAKLCVLGRHLMYEYLQQRGGEVPYSRCGKLIVSTSPQETPKLKRLLQQAQLNGLSEEECRLISGPEARALEPELNCEEALLCGATGIVDVPRLLQALEADLESYASNAGASVDVVYGCEVQAVQWREAPAAAAPKGGRRRRGHFEVRTGQGELSADHVINCAGLRALQLAHCMDVGMRPGALPRSAYFAKGSYFKLQPNARVFRHLVYPVPTDGGLGVHSTIDTSGQIRFGPDVEWLPRPLREAGESDLTPPHGAAAVLDPFAWSAADCSAITSQYYAVDERRCQAFYADIRRYYPGLPDGSLVPDYAGIRPKLTGPGVAPGDFAVLGPLEHGVPGLVHLLGMESPGLTSSLAVADMVARAIDL
jgi:L-2-hydroxyglutarate oxidase LhgO